MAGARVRRRMGRSLVAAQILVLAATTIGILPVTPVAEVRAAGNAGLQFNGTSQYVTFGDPAGNALARLDVHARDVVQAYGDRDADDDIERHRRRPAERDSARHQGSGRGETPRPTSTSTTSSASIPPTSRLAADYEEGAGQTSPSQNHPVIGATTITSNVWHHAAATFDGTTLRLYLDGTLDATLVVGAGRLPRSDSVQHAGIGTGLTSTGTAAGFFAGVIDEARIWNVARTAGADPGRQEHRDRDRPAGLIGAWHLNEGSGTTAANSSGTTINGTLTNGPLVGHGLRCHERRPPAQRHERSTSRSALRRQRSGRVDVHARDVVQADGRRRRRRHRAPAALAERHPARHQGSRRGRDARQPRHQLLPRHRRRDRHARRRLRGRRRPDARPEPSGHRRDVDHQQRLAPRRRDLRRHAPGASTSTAPSTARSRSAPDGCRESDSIQHAGLGTAHDLDRHRRRLLRRRHRRGADLERRADRRRRSRPPRTPRSRPTAGLIGAWHLNEGSGTTAANSSGTTINGTLTDGPRRGSMDSSRPRSHPTLPPSPRRPMAPPASPPRPRSM